MVIMHPDSYQKLALYKSSTYLLTYLVKNDRICLSADAKLCHYSVQGIYMTLFSSIITPSTDAGPSTDACMQPDSF